MVVLIFCSANLVLGNQLFKVYGWIFCYFGVPYSSPIFSLYCYYVSESSMSPLLPPTKFDGMDEASPQILLCRAIRSSLVGYTGILVSSRIGNYFLSVSTLGTNLGAIVGVLLGNFLARQLF